MRKVLVTGAGSYIGRHFLASLAEREARMTALARTPDALPGGLVPTVADLATEPGQACLREAARGQDAVVHLAHSLEHEAVTLESLRSLLAVRRAGTRIVFISSVAVYGTQPFGVPIVESAPCRAETLNGQLKLAGEQVLAGAPDVLVLRIAQVSGPRPEKHILARLLHDLAEERAVEVLHDGAVTLDFLDVRQLSQALADLALGQAAGTYNLGSGTPIRLYDLARSLKAEMGSRSELRVSARREGLCWAVPDCSAARQDLGLEFRNSLSEIVRELHPAKFDGGAVSRKAAKP